MMLALIQLGALLIYLARFSPVATINAIREHQPSLNVPQSNRPGSIGKPIPGADPHRRRKRSAASSWADRRDLGQRSDGDEGISQPAV